MDNIRATYLALVKGKKEKEKTSTYVRRNAIYEQIQSQNLNRRKITVRNIHKKKKKSCQFLSSISYMVTRAKENQ